ncbi:hypothetical protein IPL85_06080 [Candidatus Saccharibacteria bacterium]|nr:MAG: hypothetical protein IPL85_06080 [Candidatus Saccharibacteria bacterium]
MQTVAVFFGGQSAEHDVSIVTALTSIINPLELTKKYRVVPVYIAKDGQWYVHEKLKNVALYRSNDLKDVLAQVKPTGVILGNGMKLLVPTRLGGRKTIPVDIAFPAMHGTHGEDGELMGVFEMAGVPYVGCGVAAAAVAMDKVLAKQLVYAEGLPVTKGVWFHSQMLGQDSKAAIRQCAGLRYPLFVKPAHLGSSIGISRVENMTELQNGLEIAAHYDDKIIVEEAVHNLVEVTLPVMGNDNPEPALLEQPLLHAEDFFDFETKYLNGGKKSGKSMRSGGKKMGSKGAQGYSRIPADLPKELSEKAVKLALDVYRTLGCTGIARVDLLIDTKAKKVYFNEVNPLPGSLYAHNWAQAGISRVALVEKLTAYALERHAQRAKLTTTFTTNFLKQF